MGSSSPSSTTSISTWATGIMPYLLTRSTTASSSSPISSSTPISVSTSTILSTPTLSSTSSSGPSTSGSSTPPAQSTTCLDRPQPHLFFPPPLAPPCPPPVQSAVF